MVSAYSCFGSEVVTWMRPRHRPGLALKPTTRARLSRDLASATGRLDVVQVRVRDGVAEPLFGPSALLSVLTRADGYLVVPEPATGLDAGTEVEVTLYR